MAETPEQPQIQTTNKQTKLKDKWADISGDQDSSISESSDEEVAQKPIAKAEEPVVEEVVKPDLDKKEQRQQKIVPFDPRRMKGHGHIKTVKGGFKPEKLEKKKFELNAINNPFAFGDDSSSDSDIGNIGLQSKETQAEIQKVEETKEEETNKDEKKEKKLTKKQLKKKQQQQIEAALAELAGNNKKEDGEGKKKKKKKNKQKEQKNVEVPATEEPKVEQKKQENPVVVTQTVSIQEVLKKKAAEKANSKKSSKLSGTQAAINAIKQREKNKVKNKIVDL